MDSDDESGQIDQRMSPMGRQEPRRLYCRGCGRLLPAGFRGQFHKECLRADKRNRTQEQRRREKERFRTWLHERHCSKCGARYSESESDRPEEVSCEASQSR
jgi:hypothetical protein